MGRDKLQKVRLAVPSSAIVPLGLVVKGRIPEKGDATFKKIILNVYLVGERPWTGG